MIHVPDVNFSPLQGFIFSYFVFCHLGIVRFVIRTNNIRTHCFLNKSNYFSWSNYFMESRVNFFIYCDGSFFLNSNARTLYV